MVKALNYGFPRMGAQRELKKALEAYWQGKASREALLLTAKELRARHWKLQQDAGIDIIPCNDFSLYDHVLDMAFLIAELLKQDRAGKIKPMPAAAGL